MSHMELNESLERYNESLKRAASRARELAVITKKPLFRNWAVSLDGLRKRGLEMANKTARSKTEIESDLRIYQDNMTKKI